ncbi:mitochondrial carrier domain-containing protein [Entophlyctis helioformis]|nr:mitochondrial carrier domain-containing protein [Entophlyctis helioformis]
MSAAKEAPLPVHYSLLAGAIAGVTEILAMYPLDVVKTRFQIQVGNSEYKSIVDCFQKIIRNEGPATLYRGIVPPIMVEAPKRAIKFGANDGYRQLFMHYFGLKESQGLAVLTGMSAGLTEAVIVTTPELIKIRMQDKKNKGMYKSSSDVLSHIVKQHGVFGLARGLEATMWRHATWNGGYFGVITGIRAALPKAKSKEGVLFNNFVAGALGGTVGTMINTPFDVVKTRVQSQVNGPYKYNWTIPAIGTIAREEGVRALYKGFVPKVLRLGPGGGILLVVFEVVSGYMRKHLM